MARVALLFYDSFMKTIFATTLLSLGFAGLAAGQGGQSTATWYPWGGVPTTHTAPEIDPGAAVSALALLSGALVVIRGRRKVKG